MAGVGIHHDGGRFPMDIRTLRKTAVQSLRHLDWAPPLLARLIIGAVFVPTGWGKLHNLPDIVSFFRELGIPSPELQAPFVSSIELVCGALVLVGLGTRLAAVPLIGTMVVAIATAVWPQLDTARELFGKEELHYMALLAYLVVSGPGAVSLDALVARWMAAPASRASRPTMQPARS
jgi:putative oxidoreductase